MRVTPAWLLASSRLLLFLLILLLILILLFLHLLLVLLLVLLLLLARYLLFLLLRLVGRHGDLAVRVVVALLDAGQLIVAAPLRVHAIAGGAWRGLRAVLLLLLRRGRRQDHLLGLALRIVRVHRIALVALGRAAARLLAGLVGGAAVLAEAHEAAVVRPQQRAVLRLPSADGERRQPGEGDETYGRHREAARAADLRLNLRLLLRHIHLQVGVGVGARHAFERYVGAQSPRHWINPWMFRREARA
mmetsp:Transcript_20297/g.51770  ORF Transcript_20297/g.51770 Transcript_20297/m.51770 type:complete len:246 (-) Transcript_20297:7-744(-)